MSYHARFAHYTNFWMNWSAAGGSRLELYQPDSRLGRHVRAAGSHVGGSLTGDCRQVYWRYWAWRTRP